MQEHTQSETIVTEEIAPRKFLLNVSFTFSGQVEISAVNKAEALRIFNDCVTLKGVTFDHHLPTGILSSQSLKCVPTKKVSKTVLS